jgi:23S rRNA (adenine-N6)-dimethyltransferase
MLPVTDPERKTVSRKDSLARSGGSGGSRSQRDLRRRTLSQNFLLRSGADKYLALLSLDPELLCVEVGAGEGVLTERLADHCRALIAHELDPDVARTLTRRLGPREGVQVVVGDFLRSTPPAEAFQVVGNVPFSRTSDIIAWCLSADRLVDATLITQLEYAKKRTGVYGRWSQLTVLTWPEFSWEIRGVVPRHQFRPVPRVDGGVLRVARRPVSLLPAATLPAYRRLVERGFIGVGGSLFASLSRVYPRDRLGLAFKEAGVDRSTVVAFVTPDQWLTLFTALGPGGTTKPPRTRSSMHRNSSERARRRR